MPTGGTISNIKRWVGQVTCSAAAIFLTCFAAWAAGISVPSGSFLNVNDNELNVDGSVYVAGTISTTTGTIRLNGDWTVTGVGAYLAGSGTVRFNAPAGTQTLTPGTVVDDGFFNLVHEGAGTVVVSTNSLDVNGDLTNALGTFNANAMEIYLAGNWNNAATFQHGNGAVFLDGTDQSIYGTTTFYDLSKQLTSAASHQLTFENSVEQTVAHSLTLKGFNLANQLLLRSDQNNVQAQLTLDLAGVQDIRYVDVKDNDASNGLIGTSMTLVGRQSTDSTNNINWLFGSVTIKWDGSEDSNWQNPYNWNLGLVPGPGDTAIIRVVDEDNGNAPIPNQPRLTQDAQVGNLEIRTGSSVTTDQHNLTVDNALTLAGNLILDGMPAGETVTAASIVNTGTVTFVGMQNGQTTADITTNIVIGGSPLTTFYNLTINEENIASQRDTFTTNAVLTVTHDLTLTEGLFQPTAAVNVTNNALVSGGTFDLSTNAVTFTPAQQLTVSGGTLNAQTGTLDINTVVISGGTFSAPTTGRSFTVSGDFTHTAGAFTTNNGTVVFDATSAVAATNQNISGSTTFYGFTKNIPLGATQPHTLTFQSGSTTTVTQLLTLNGLDAANRLFIRASTPGVGNEAFLNLQAGGGQVIRNVNVQDNDASGGLLLVARGSSFNAGNTVNWSFSGITLKWDGSQSTDWNDPLNWDLGMAPDTMDSVIIRTIDEDNGNAVITNQPVLANAVSVANLTLREPDTTLRLNGFDLAVVNALAPPGVLSNEGTIFLRGTENVNIELMDTDSGTFTYTGDNTGGSFTITAGTRPEQFYSLSIADTNAVPSTFLVDQNIYVNGMLSVSGGTFTPAANSIDLGLSFNQTGGSFTAPGAGQSFTVSGDFTHTGGTFNNNSGTVTLDATSAVAPTTQTISGSTTFYDLVKSVPGAATQVHTLKFDNNGNQVITHQVTLTGLAGNALVLQSISADPNPLVRDWEISLGAGGLQVINNVDVQDSDAAGGLTLVARSSADHSAPAFNNTNWSFGTTTLTWTGAVSTDWSNPLNWNLGMVPITGDNVVIPLTANQPQLTAGSGAVSLTDLTLQGGATLTLNGFGLTVAGTLSNEGNIIATGAEAIAITTTDHDSGTFTYTGNGGGNHNLDKFNAGQPAVEYYNLVIADAADSFTPLADLMIYGNLSVTGGTLAASAVSADVNGSVSFSGGTLSAPGSGESLTVGGSWTNAGGTFVNNSGLVTFDTSSAITITGNTTFFDLSSADTLGKTILFGAGSNQTVLNNLTLTGDQTNRLILHSTVPGTPWTLTIPSGVKIVSNLDVQDSIAVVAGAKPYILAFNSIDQPAGGGGSSNTGWQFIDLKILYPATGTTVGQTPAVLGKGVPDDVVSVIDINGDEVARARVDANGNFRTTVGDTQDVAGPPLDKLALDLGANRLAAVYQSVVGNYNDITVIAGPTTTQVPIITTPADGSFIVGARPTISGQGAPGGTVYYIASDAAGHLLLTMPPDAYAGQTTVQPDGSFSLRLPTTLPANTVYVSVVVNGVSSPIVTYTVYDVHGVVFDTMSNQPLKGAKVYIYKQDGTLAVPGVDLPPENANPQVTEDDGIFAFLTEAGNYYFSSQATGYTFPTQFTNAELPPGRNVGLGARGEVFTTDFSVRDVDIPMDVQSNIFKIEKDANKTEAKIGDVVTYTVTIESLLTDNPVNDARLVDIIPPGFKYLSNRVLLDNVPIANPSGNRPLSFDVGVFAPRQKKTMRYQLVVGAGVAPGDYENVATMKYPNGVRISNRATETVKIIMDPLFDLGSVFGKVFYDWNDNGRQDEPDFIYEDREQVIEGPVGNVRIVMEDGTSVIADKSGQFHIPKLLPGRHLLRVDEKTLPANAYVTNDKVQVIDVTPGSVTKLNFGINLDNREIVGEDARFFQNSIRIDQDMNKPLPLLNVDMFNGQILLYNDAVIEQPEFRLFMNYTPFIKAWQLNIIDKDTKRVVKEFTGTPFNLRDPVYWDGRDSAGKYIRTDRHYAYYLKVGDGKGNWDETAEKDIPLKVLTEQEWDARHLKKTEKELMDEAKAESRRRRDWVVASSKANTLKLQTIPIAGETLRIDPQSSDLRQVRVLKGGQLFMDIPIPERHALTAMDLVEGVSVREQPLEIILPEGEYELEVVNAEGKVSSGVEDMTAPPSAAAPDLAASADAFLKGTPSASGTGLPADGKVVKYRRPLKVGEDYMMFVAMGDGKVGYNMNRGNIEPVQGNEKYQKGFYQEGKMAYYLKGKIKGKYLVTSSFDTERQQKDMFRSIKEDEYYPIYGDSSTVNYDATNTQGPLFLLVEWDKSQAIWGNYAIDFKDTDFAKFSRTLYGGKIDYTSVASTEFGDPRTKVAVFHAEVRQRSAHAELLGTGGSLYYLKHKDVVVGSDKIRLEVRDAVTGQVKTTTEMKDGVDYDFDAGEGRILFWQPVSMAADTGRIISNNLLNGDPVYVVADYEYYVKDKIAESTRGGRVAQAVTDNVVVGATYVSETQSSGANYELRGQDVTVRLAKDSTVRMEYAQSTSKDAPAYLSTDGGISYSEVNTGSNLGGRAYGISQDARLFERVGLASYYKWVDPGFSTAGTTSEQGKELKGINMTFDLTPVTRLTASYDIQKLIEQGNLQTTMQVGAQETRTTAMQIVHEAKRLKLTGEFRQQQVFDKNGKYDSAASSKQVTAAMQAEYALNAKTDVLLKHQIDLLGQLGSATTLGVRRKLTDRFTGTLEETIGSAGSATTAGLTANVFEKLALTTQYGMTLLKTGERINTASVIADGELFKGLSVKTSVSQNISSTGVKQKTASNTATWGTTVRGQLNDKTALEGTFGAVQNPDRTQRGTAAFLASTTIDETALKAGLGTSADSAGQLTKAISVDATSPQDKSGHQVSSGVKVEDTATDGKKTVITLGDTARLGPTSQLAVNRSFGFNNSVQDKDETYTVSTVKDGRKLETSYARKLSDKQAEHSSSNIFGLTGDINDRWAANASLEQGKVQNADGTQTDRIAFAGGAGYLEKDLETGEERLKSSTKAEVRLDKGAVDKTQYVFMQSTEGKVTDETTLTAKFDWSQTKNKDTDKIEAQYKEIILGAAYRPIANDRLNLFGRYTYKMNQSPEGQTNASTTDVENVKMQVLTVEGAYDLTEDWQVVERLAYRVMEEKVAGFDFNRTHTWLLVNRLNYRMGRDWKIGGEYRVLTQREAKDQKRGFLVEAVRGVNDNLEVGVGYNFTDFVDDLTNLDYTVAGPFIRMTGKLYDRTPEERARARAKWLDRRVQYYAMKMIEDEFKKKDSPVVLELNQMYRLAQTASEKENYEESRKIYKDIVLATNMMYEEAAQFVRKHISFEEKLFNAHQRALEYYDRGDYWMAKKIWEKIVEEASKAMVE